MIKLILALIISLIAFVTGVSRSSGATMPHGFCKELRHIDRHKQPLTYRDTRDACIWDWNHPKR